MAEKEFAGAEGRAMALLRLLSEDRLQVLGPDGEGRYALQANGADLPEGAEALLEALERAESLRVPGERLEKDLRRFLKGGDLTDELARTRLPWREYPISEFFDEEFFETKKVVYTPR